MFEGFSKGAIDFLWGIRLNNERSWFEAHKEEYRTLILGPLRDLGTQVYDMLCEQFPQECWNLHLSRIHRDARRLYGRGPYRDHMWFVIRPPKESGVAHPALYFELAPEYFSYGLGYSSATPATMARLRERIDRDPKPLEKLARKLTGTGFVLEGTEYKRPKGDVGALLNPWYNRRQLALTHDENCEGILFTPDLANQVASGLAFLVPYYRYFLSLDQTL